ncbi:MAG: hypothetical protein ACYCVD_09660 [Desulfitobacteriaceae bacterium]
MSSIWNATWEAHPDVFIASNWQECPPEKKKTWHLPSKFSYFQGGETPLRVGIIACSTIPREEELLLAGILWGNRLSNGAKTVIYFVAPDFSPFFLLAIEKIGGTLSARAVYWRERLRPSLYLVPDSHKGGGSALQPLGDLRPDWQRWGQGLNPVTRQQLEIVKNYFYGLAGRGVRFCIKPQNISVLWGNLEIAEVTRRGRKFELMTKAKWERDPEQVLLWQKAGWVDASGSINSEFCYTVSKILANLEAHELGGTLRSRELLSLWLYRSVGIISTLWGDIWEWPWLPQERNQNWVTVLSQWFYFQGNGQLSVVCPILEKPLSEASESILLACVLEKSSLLTIAKDAKGQKLEWDGRIHWLTLPEWEEDLRKWHCWLKFPEQFPIWSLPENWREQRLEYLTGSFS